MIMAMVEEYLFVRRYRRGGPEDRCSNVGKLYLEHQGIPGRGKGADETENSYR